MELRPELMPPCQERGHVEALLPLVVEIANLVDASLPADDLITRFNRLTGLDYDSAAFWEIEGAMDIESFTRIALAGRPPKRSDISEQEFLEIIERLYNAGGSEAEMHYWLDLLEVNLDCPEISDLIYWPDRDMTPAELLARVRAGDAAKSLP